MNKYTLLAFTLSRHCRRRGKAWLYFTLYLISFRRLVDICDFIYSLSPASVSLRELTPCMRAWHQSQNFMSDAQQYGLVKHTHTHTNVYYKNRCRGEYNLDPVHTTYKYVCPKNIKIVSQNYMKHFRFFVSLSLVFHHTIQGIFSCIIIIIFCCFM